MGAFHFPRAINSHLFLKHMKYYYIILFLAKPRLVDVKSVWMFKYYYQHDINLKQIYRTDLQYIFFAFYREYSARANTPVASLSHPSRQSLPIQLAYQLTSASTSARIHVSFCSLVEPQGCQKVYSCHIGI